MLRIGVVLLGAFLAGTGMAGAQATFDRGPEGCWAADFAASDLGGGPAPQAETLCISRNRGTVAFTVDAVLPNHAVRHVWWSGAPDGTPHPLQGAPDGEQDALHRSAAGLVAENTHGDGSRVHEDISFSPDARTMTVDVTAKTAKGETRQVKIVARAVALAYPTAPAVYTDPAAEAKPAPGMTVVHIPSHGVEINGVLYSPGGTGPHPTLVICHGLPGNEKNLDLAQAVRRAGWNAVTFNYRGSWGSPGSFRFAQNLQDADAVLAYLRDAKNAAALGIDTKRMVLAGHSMGGWVTVNTAAHEHDLLGVVLISAADMGGLAEASTREQGIAEMRDNMEALAGVTAESMADEMTGLAASTKFSLLAPKLTQVPMLVLSADQDGLAPNTDAMIHDIETAGGTRVTSLRVDTDHSWSDQRVGLASLVISWLQQVK